MADNAFDVKIARQARSSEPDRYFAGLFVAPRRRQLYWLIAAFHGELNRILQVTREPMLAEIRLQWWRDMLAAYAQSASAGHDLADALCNRLRAGELELGALQAMIEARSLLLSGDINGGLHDIEQFAARLEGQSFSVAVCVLSDHVRPFAAHHQQALDDAGRAYGLARLAAAARRSRVHSSNWDIVVQPLAQSSELGGAVQDAAAKAYRRLQDSWQRLPVPWQICFLPLAVIPAYLSSRQSGPTPRSKVLANIFDMRRLWLIWRAARRGHLV